MSPVRRRPRCSPLCGMALASCLVTVSAAAAVAQTGGFGGRTAGEAADAHQCGDCHLGDHGMSQALRLARSATTQAIALRAGLLTPDPATEMCLGCHFTPQDRSVVTSGLSEERLVPIGTGRYLGPSLADDHPLGEVRDVPRSGVSSWPDASRRPFASRGAEIGASQDLATVRCTSCHVVHRGSESWQSAAMGGDLCGGCHDPTGYGAGAHGVVECLTCHRMHDAPGESLTEGPGREGLCIACHGSGLGSEAGLGPRGRRAHEDGPRQGRCSDCHSVHGGALGLEGEVRP